MITLFIVLILIRSVVTQQTLLRIGCVERIECIERVECMDSMQFSMS